MRGTYIYKANKPMAHKRNVVTAITARAIRFTNPTNRPESLRKVKDLMKANSFPNKFVSNIIKGLTDFTTASVQASLKSRNSSQQQT